jgi:hypothetical protein
MMTKQFNFASSASAPIQALPPMISISAQIGQSADFSNGTFEIDGRSVTVESVRIEPRRILISASSTSEDADRIYARLKEILASIDPNKRFSQVEPLSVAQETACTVTLDVPFETFFSEPVRRFTAALADRLSSPGAKPIVRPANFSIGVNYAVTDQRLILQGITFSPKQIVIEPRVGTDPAELRYFTASPTDSDTHLRLVEELESSLRRHVSSPVR